MSVALTAFYPLILPEVPGAPRVLVKKQILESAIDFCVRSRVYLSTPDAYPIEAGISEYDFDAPTHETVHQIMSATLSGRNIPCESREWCDSRYPGWRDGTATGYPSAITQSNVDTFTLVPAPTAAETLVLELHMKPSKTATRLPDILYHEYEQAIVSGALSRLHAMFKKAWSDPGQAAAHLAIANNAITAANLRQSKAFGRGKLRVTGRYL